MEKITSWPRQRKIQKFLGGALKTIKTSSLTRISKKIILFGQPLAAHEKRNNYHTYSIFGKTVYKVSLLDLFRKRYCKYFDGRHDDIYILRSNSGEAYLILTYFIDALLKKNNSKNPLLVATKQYHIDMIKMLCPDIPFFYMGNMEIDIIGEQFRIDNFRYFLFFDPLYFFQVEQDIKNNLPGKSHYFNAICNRVGITKDNISARKITVYPDDERSMLDKIARTGLNLENFVFLSPESNSNELYDDNFWDLLINCLKEKGYDIFVNLTKDDIKLQQKEDYKICYLSFAESFALAKRARKIIALRSGFIEFLLQTGIPMDVLYTRFRYRRVFGRMEAHHVMSGFGINQIPLVDKSMIREFNMFETSPADYLQQAI